jgi:mannose-6-phosphate isomerase-like protein (cupin superfamily)
MATQRRKPARPQSKRKAQAHKTTPKRRLSVAKGSGATPRTARVAKFLAQHVKDAPFVQKGLRSFFEYRDLGLTEATGGRYGGFVVRALRSGNESTGCHYHLPDAQIIYILKGWLRAEYGGQGIVKLEAGSILHNPPGNAHNVFEFSDDLEFIEITAPSEYATVDVESVQNPRPVNQAASA